VLATLPWTPALRRRPAADLRAEPEKELRR
jgi:hypothetical protein